MHDVFEEFSPWRATPVTTAYKGRWNAACASGSLGASEHG
jgi:hypothetical protein